MTKVSFLPNKALIYATNKRGLLIFREPEFAEVPPQVPGGTIDEGEDPMTAAKREFAEETGIETPIEMSFLELDEHGFERAGQPHQVNRYYFHAAVSDDLPEVWEHYEEFAHDGSKPVLFRFSWVSLEKAPTVLGLGMAASIPSLTAKLVETS